MDRALIMARVRTLQKAVDELAGMLSALPDGVTPESVEEEIIPTKPDEKEMMSAREVQNYLGIGESTFYTWIRQGLLPEGRLWGTRMRRWKRSELEEWRKSRQRVKIEVPVG